MDNNKFYTTKDIAAMFGVTQNTVRTWIRTGKLQAIELGARAGYRVTQEHIDQFVEKRTTER